MKTGRSFLCALFAVCLLPACAWAQGMVDISSAGVKVETGGTGKPAVSISGASGSTVEPDLEMEGVTVINGDVYIDGSKVPADRVRYKSPKTGKVYVIRHTPGGNVSVEEK
ncbi:MAG: hypothetical protein M0P39_06480 [Rhodocyclaceae bacterium]|jgi:hypothetical protein|nr:hypothetical protein [Rhodocyclaceae bacterium]